MTSANCICCGSTSTIDLISIERIPVLCNELHDCVEDARKAPTGRMDLCFCQECGHYFNRSYDPDKLYYSPNYETSLYSSAVFQEYADALANRLIARYGIRGKQILEIGCGRGEFLRQICLKGDNSGLGFDTSAPFNGDDQDHAGITFIQDYFSQKYAHVQADLVICQQVLEHIADPKQFLERLAATKTFCEGNPVFYCEVPNGLYSIAELGIWDLIYEHVSYFSAQSLERLFISSGFEILDLNTAFGDQYLYVEARLSKAAPALSELTPLSNKEGAVARNFANRFRAKIANYTRILESEGFEADRTFIWGAGSKGITFSNLMDPDGKLAGLVDRSPAKQGKYVGGTGARIFRPAQINAERMSGVFVMNPQYLNEIERDLEGMGISAKHYPA